MPGQSNLSSDQISAPDMSSNSMAIPVTSNISTTEGNFSVAASAVSSGQTVGLSNTTTPVSNSATTTLSMETTGNGVEPEIARVIMPFMASSVEQLSLKVGQLVQIRKRSPKGWWEGELQTFKLV
ncbi:unnamed protein product [Protopolystoma xenopodis]|uniref:SH3 domain-containing protein n=1 Tax=Protopolystoma xenopodis TaxID=117903 RepID=A0A448XS49_9PLAT|nr:unnamed protein product [Protopolystoma xenopodis]